MTAPAPARKRAELSAKVASLRAEFSYWRAESEDGHPLEKHHSQIRRVTARLDVLADLVDEEIARADPVRGGQEIELRLLDVHHLWDFFRTKLAMRYPVWLRDFLVVADELVWSCYSPAQRYAVKAGSVDPAAVREPPLTYFGTDDAPSALSRHAAYFRNGRAQELYTEHFADELRSLPVPVTVVPWHQAGHLPDMLLLAHETGHHVEEDFALTSDLRAVVDALQLPETRAVAWQRWIGEVFADVYGVLGEGSAYVVSLVDFLAASAEEIAREPARADYPTTHLRIQVALAALSGSCPDDPRGPALAAAWWSANPVHSLGAFDDDVGPLVDALLTGPYPSFGTVALTEVLSFEPLRQETGVDEARLAAQMKPQSGDPRALLAAATLCFADDPIAYRDGGIAGRTLQRVREVQLRGTRFRSQAEDLPARAEADRRAAERLYQRMTGDGFHFQRG